MSKKGKLWSLDFVLVLVVVLLSFVICQGNNNGTPIYVVEAGSDTVFAGWLILDFSFSAGLARIFISSRIDATSRRKVMLWGTAFTFAGSFGAVLVPGVIPLVALRAFQGIGFGLCTTAASTAVADIAPMSRLGEALGYFGLGQSLGFVIGPSLAIALVTLTFAQSPFGPGTLFVGMTLLAILLAIVVLACTYEQHPERLDATCAYRIEHQGAKESSGSSFKDGDSGDDAPQGFLRRTFELAALRGGIPIFVFSFGLSVVTSYASKYGVDSGFDSPGIFFIVAAVTMTAIRLLGGRLFDIVPPKLLMVLPTICGIGCFLLMIFGQGELGFYTAGALFGLAMGISYPICNTVAVRCAPLDRRGAASSLFQLANDVGVGCGAVVSGCIIDALGYQAVFCEGAIMLVVSFVVALVVFPSNNKEWNG